MKDGRGKMDEGEEKGGKRRGKKSKKGRKDKSVATLTTKHSVRYVRVVLLAM